MLTNYLKIAWRNLRNNKAFTAINIVGLALGMATCLLISLFVLDELSYDRFHTNADRIVRVVFRGTAQGGKINEAHVMPPTAQALKADYPEVQEATRLRHGGTPTITAGDKLFTDKSVGYADPNLFRVFTLPLVQGDPKTALVRPNTVVLTQTAAHTFFGADNPIGKVLTVKGSNTSVQVTGVMADLPTNSHFHFDLFVSMASLPDAQSPSWMTSEYFTYLLLPNGYDYKRLEAKLPQVVDKYMSAQFRQAFGMSLSDFRKKGDNLGLYLQPMTAIHLHSDFAHDLEPSGDIRYVYIFGAIAVFMLLIACINFMNLSTAGASRRGREVGIRKVLGSLKRELISQFLTESLLLTALALVLSTGLVYLALPLFNDLSGKTLDNSLLRTPWLLAVLLGFGLLVGLLAGSYPAFLLSSFRPIAVLKGWGTFGRGGNQRVWVRSGLVVFQFFISVMLIIGTTIVYQQLNYIQHKKIGYDKDQVLILSDTWALGGRQEAFRQQLLQDPRVVNVSQSDYVPAGPSYNNNFFVYPDVNASRPVKTLRYEVDERYVPTLGMELVSGRNFSRSFGTDSTAVLINETAAQTLGWRDSALGHTIARTEDEGNKAVYRVIGVVKDFHFRSLHEPIAPLVMTLGRSAGTTIVKVKARDMAGLVASLSKEWTAFKPDRPFTYSFLDQRYVATYRAEQKVGLMLGGFAGLTIFVACLGLFGLAMFMAEQRRKEIGVRKVLGASIASVVALLSREFLKPVLIAIALASPVAWYAMNRWLADFAYRIDINWWVFALAGVLAVGIALLTVSFQSIRAALMNPVKSLRSE